MLEIDAEIESMLGEIKSYKNKEGWEYNPEFQAYLLDIINKIADKFNPLENPNTSLTAKLLTGLVLSNLTAVKTLMYTGPNLDGINELVVGYINSLLSSFSSEA